ncbi:MAG: AMP-dependent synthetase [Chloracidobacterium sp. CP2_5A]|nr:MAG: AMP-dependent synthetase [Chloracidobacterium sp. CP2_5A]
MSNASASGAASAATAAPETLLDAIEIIVGGRNLDAQAAKRLGLVDDIAPGAQAAVEVAARLAREYILTGAGPLADAFARRQAAGQAWAAPQNGLSRAEVEAHPRVARLLAQARAVGREKAVRRALDCLFFGLEQGYAAGLKHEAQVFAEAVADPEGGQSGIQAFLDKRSAPLPPRPLIMAGSPEERALLERGELLPIGTPFYPGLTPLPKYQYAQGVIKDPSTGAAVHGDPKDVERHFIVPVPEPSPAEALVYVLVSEVNFNDIWALTGIPISVMDDHDQDFHITGSGGIGLVVALGSEVKREGRLQTGDLVSIYSGQNNLFSPLVGLDPMFADFGIQGYQEPNGSHGQFLLAQPPQLHHKLEDLTIEAAGSYMLNLGTIYRALFTTLKVAPGKRLFVEGAATGTGFEAVKVAVRNNVKVTGLVSSAERAEFVKSHGATGVINRRAPELAGCFTKVPEDAARWADWEAAGEPLLDAFRAQNDGRLADYAVSHAGELSFPRSFQLLAPGGVLTFYGASSGYHFTFMGKPGAAAPADMLQRVGLRAGQSALVYYGVSEDIVDEAGIEIIEAVREARARVVVATRTDGQKEFVASLGFGDAVRGIVSIEDIQRRYGADFEWPDRMPAFPNPKADTDAFKEAVRLFTEINFKPFAASVGRLLSAPDNPRGYPDLIFERAGQDTLGVSATLVKPYTGRVVYAEDMSGRRYSFYAPQVWMRQRRIDMPTASIWGTHLNNAYEIVAMNDAVAAGLLDVTPPVVVEWLDLPEAHQAMWDNRHAGTTYVVNHALPRLGLRNKAELFEAWAAQSAGAAADEDASVIFR